jgi:ribosomal protein S14
MPVLRCDICLRSQAVVRFGEKGLCVSCLREVQIGMKREEADQQPPVGAGA